MIHSDDDLRRLLTEQADRRLGPRREVPAFDPDHDGHGPATRKPGGRTRTVRPGWVVSLLAAACVAAVIGGASAATGIFASHNHNPAEPAASTSTRTPSTTAPMSRAPGPVGTPTSTPAGTPQPGRTQLGRTQPGTSQPRSTDSPSTTANSTTTRRAATSSGGHPTPAPVTTPSSPVNQAVLPCPTGVLSVSLGSADSGMSQTRYALTLRNTGSVRCSLRGYPGVSYVSGDAGTQVGAPAVRVSSSPVTTVILAPGRAASAVLDVVQPLAFSPAQCKITTVRGFRVYPPNQTAAVFVSRVGQACSATSLPGNTLTVTVLTTH